MDIIPDGWFRDEGCKEATEYLGYQSRCNKCPFDMCLKEIRYGTRTLLQRQKEISKTFELTDRGLLVSQISHSLKLPETTVKRWITNRTDIEYKLHQWGDVCQVL